MSKTIVLSAGGGEGGHGVAYALAVEETRALLDGEPPSPTEPSAEVVRVEATAEAVLPHARRVV